MIRNEKETLPIDEDYNEVKNVYGNTIYGVRITYKDTGASIFLPLGGRIIDKSPEEVNELGFYWASTGHRLSPRARKAAPTAAIALAWRLADPPAAGVSADTTERLSAPST